MGRLTAAVTAMLVLSGCGGRSVGGGNQNTGQDAGTANTVDASPWRPSVDGLGDDGWRDSAEPWRPPVDPHYSHGMHVWSHPGAVYTAYKLPYTDEQNQGDVALGISVNRGSGWSPWSDLGDAQFTEISKLRGFPDGFELVVLGIRHPPDNQMREDCGIFHMVGGEIYSFTEGPDRGHLYIVDDQLAYIATEDRVIRLDVDHWEPLPATPPYALAGIWATRNVLFGVGSSGVIVSLEGDQWRMHDSGTLANLTGVWGFADDDIYVCDSSGNLLHYDGVVWTPIDWPNAPSERDTGGFGNIWGSQGVLYLYAPRMLVRYDGQGFDALADWRCRGGQDHCELMLRIEDLWGNSPDEVFLAIAEGHLEQQDGGWRYLYDEVYLLYFDGELFHWF